MHKIKSDILRIITDTKMQHVYVASVVSVYNK